jgi:putative tricarboxylic transport membrane protein
VVKKTSKYPEKFGTGVIDGIVASEASNNAVIGGAMVPLIALGIPGDANTAMLLGALMIHGLTPGPALIRNNGDLVYAIFAAVAICSLIMLIVEFWGMRIFVQMLRIPKHLLLPMVMVLCCVGAFSVNGSIFDVYVLIGFGILGFLMSKNGFPRAPLVLGMVLGGDLERNLRQALQLSRNSLVPFVTRPISGFFFVIICIVIVSTAISQMKTRRNNKASEDKEND